MINLRYFEDGAVGVALDETTTMQDVDDLLWIFDCQSVEEVKYKKATYYIFNYPLLKVLPQYVKELLLF